MPTLNDVLRQVRGLRTVDVDWLHMLVGDWQLISDLSAADLVLWGRADEDVEREEIAAGGDGDRAKDDDASRPEPATTDAADRAGRPRRRCGWRVVAHVRPNTGPLVFYDDLVGDWARPMQALVIDQAMAARGVVTAGNTGPGQRFEAVPVIHRGVPIAVVSKHSDRAHMRAPSPMESVYRSSADTLFAMIRDGDFPLSGDPKSQRHGTPRVGDGVIRIDADGVVQFASPNATSALLRIGHQGAIAGEYLSKIVADVLEDNTTVDETLPLVTMGRAAWRTDIEANGGVMAIRAVPLKRRRSRVGAVILVRDISELRRQQQQLLTKDATIREIHHRVKNNLQTVAALLRLQGRRVSDTSAAASLAEAGRRISTIALVHDTLSRSLEEVVAFDEIATRVVNAILDVAGGAISWSKQGTFGDLAADDATALAMVVAEIVQNTVDHAFGPEGGHVLMRVSVDAPDTLTVEILDDGVGLPEDFTPGRSGLGTRIVRAFVQDLKGRIEWSTRAEGGTRARFNARLRGTALPSAG